MKIKGERSKLDNYLEDITKLIECSAIDMLSSRLLVAYQSASTEDTLEEDATTDLLYIK